MAAMQVRAEVAPEDLRLMLLAYGLDHPYRVIALEEILHSLPHIRREKAKEALDQLASEGLVTKFSSRYCFNKPIPAEFRQLIQQAITPSGTVRAEP
jgi:RIO-like serine/threonine protein kinase